MKKTKFVFTNQTEASGLVIDVPAGIQSKTVLMETLGANLLFPEYYGANWDAFEECIRDLSWLKESDITIRHIDIPLDNDTIAAKTYLEILKDAVTKWESESSHDLIVIFPSGFQMMIESLIKQGAQ